MKKEGQVLSAAGRLYALAPVPFALGVVLYFQLSHEPVWWVILGLLLVVVAVRRHRIAGRSLGLGLAGLLVPALHVALLGPLPSRLPETPQRITGVIERIDARPTGERLVVRLDAGPRGVDRVMLNARDPLALDVGVRATLVSTFGYGPGPALPGQYDHARRTYFEGVDAIGIVIAGPFGRIERSDRPLDRARFAIAALRGAVADRIAHVLEGQTAALATALLTGQRGALSGATTDAMRGSGLAHVLAISGMHMGLFCTTLFVALRGLLAAANSAGLALPVKKIAAAGALLGGTFYLLISGAQIATQRAYIMTAIVCLSVLLDRPALTLRNVATAAFIVLAIAPESIMGASFQMSFAATVALVAIYERWNARPRSSETWMAVPGQQAASLLVTSTTAGLATTPYAAFHFSRVAAYGLAANIAAMPLISFVVMPAGLASLIAMPLGLERVPLIVMGYALDGVLHIATTVSGWPDAVRTIPPPRASALVALSVCFYVLAIAKGRCLRSACFSGLAVASAAHLAAPTPLLRIAENARTVLASTTDQPSVLTGSRYAKFAVARWEDAGTIDPTTRMPDCSSAACNIHLSNIRVTSAWTPTTVQRACLTADVLVTPLRPPEDCPEPDLIVGPDALYAGALLVHEGDDGVLRLAPVTPRQRPWRRPQ